MDFAMTNRAIAEPSGPDVVEGRRLTGRHAWGHAVTLQAQLCNLGPTQHLGVDGAMRFVAGCTAIHLEGRMLKNKRALLIGMAGKTALFGAECQRTKGAIVLGV